MLIILLIIVQWAIISGKCVIIIRNAIEWNGENYYNVAGKSCLRKIP